MMWDIFERIYSGHWFLTSYNAYGWVRGLPKFGGGNYISTFIANMDHGVCKYIYRTDEFDTAARFTAHRLLYDHRWRRRIYRKIETYTKRYFAAGERLRKLPLSSLSDRQLVREMDAIARLQDPHQVYSILVNGVVIDGRNHLSTMMQVELRQAVPDDRHLDQHWAILTMPTRMSLRQKKEYAMVQLADQVKNGSVANPAGRLRRLHQQYAWLDYQYLGPPASFHQFETELEAAIKENVNRDLPRRLRALKKKQETLMNRLHLNRRARFLVRLAQHVLWQKGYRKDIQYHGFSCYEPFLREVVKRKRVDDWKLLTFLMPWEVGRFILRGTPRAAELRARRSFSCFIVQRKKATFLIGREARTYMKRLGLVEDYSHLTETRGQCAFPGKARGVVQVIQTPDDLGKMRKGCILVSQATSPDLLPAMKKAAAIVTNTGGLICHAAITARELHIPCIVGTGNANMIFRDGDRVEVDATKGIVRKL